MMIQVAMVTAVAAITMTRIMNTTLKVAAERNSSAHDG
jgi:hypothetical protein